MTRTALAIAALLALAACGEDPEATPAPAVETLYKIKGASLACFQTEAQHGTPAEGPFTGYVCTWRNVTVDGLPVCKAKVTFTRATALDDWTIARFDVDDAC